MNTQEAIQTLLAAGYRYCDGCHGLYSDTWMAMGGKGQDGDPLCPLCFAIEHDLVLLFPEAEKLISNAEATLRNAHSIFECICPGHNKCAGIVPDSLGRADDLSAFMEKIEKLRTGTPI